jgi:hypothetical protein
MLDAFIVQTIDVTYEAKVRSISASISGPCGRGGRVVVYIASGVKASMPYRRRSVAKMLGISHVQALRFFHHDVVHKPSATAI